MSTTTGRILCVPSDYPTLEDALHYCAANSCITLSSGRYEIPENRHLGITHENVHVIADEDGGAGPEVVFGKGACLFVEAAECRMQGITFSGIIQAPMPMISITATTHCALEKCVIKSASYDGVMLVTSTGTRLTMTDCDVYFDGVNNIGEDDHNKNNNNNNSSTLTVAIPPPVAERVITTKGIVLGSGSYVRMVRCVVSGLHVGCVFNPTADGIMTECSLSGCDIGLAVNEGCTPKIEFCVFRDCRDSAVLCHLGKPLPLPVKIASCRISSCQGVGLRCVAPGNIDVSRCVIEDCSGAGVHCLDRSTPLLRNSAVSRCGVGVIIEDGSDAEFTLNEFHDNERAEVTIKGLGTASRFSGNTFCARKSNISNNNNITVKSILSVTPPKTPNSTTSTPGSTQHSSRRPNQPHPNDPSSSSLPRAVIVSSDANPVFDRDTFDGYEEVFVLERSAHCRAREIVMKNVGTTHDACAVRVMQDATLLLEATTLSRCSGCGVIVDGGGAAQISRCTWSDIQRSCFVFGGDGRGELRRNVVMGVGQGWLYFPVGSQRLIETYHNTVDGADETALPMMDY
eukprot:PhM_4_TR11296/c0_g1_i1/m.93322